MGERIRIIDGSGKEKIENKAETPEEIREKLKNPEYLPSTEEIKKAFNNLKDRKEWNKFCHGKKETSHNEPIYEFLNKEFISALGDYLITRAEELGTTKEKPILILEVGAGNGRLRHFLEERFKEKSYKERVPEAIKIIATDSGESWGPPYNLRKPHFPVEKLSYSKALKKYNPDIVIASWMPAGVDWTGDIRHKASVKEYILIGLTNETGFGQCGDPWLTWGVYDPNWFWAINEKEFEDKKMSPPYQVGGFGRVDLDEISKNQICSKDYPYRQGGIVQHSKTVSFRRK